MQKTEGMINRMKHHHRLDITVVLLKNFQVFHPKNG